MVVPAAMRSVAATAILAGDEEGERAEAAPFLLLGLGLGVGLLGLEAANALRTLGLRPHVVEVNPRLMPQQVDSGGGEHLARMIGELGIDSAAGKKAAATRAKK